MSAIIIDGRLIREKVLEELKEQIACLNLHRPLKLAIFQYNPQISDALYVSSLKKVAKKLEVEVEVKTFEDLETLKSAIYEYNVNDFVDGIMLQIANKSDYLHYTSLILPEKDVDGASPLNLGKLIRKDKGLRPATADAVIRILKEAGYEIRGKNACVLGRSFRSGLPIAIMLMNEDATCTVCHSYTKDINVYTTEADILVVAVGRAGFIGADMVKEGAFVIDVGINQVGDKVVGDVNFDEVKEKSAFITPVPGGVGSVTDVMIFRNLIKGVIFRNEKRY
ncbi:MAG: bifunctional 5,10-methylenetetrahydrofolate dehydrogenase/5,10-methenyltetrahydrofolate cyclohydrolase [bacterium]|nr:bifunctional 5,10-methylenetetrahydrofolate dehydrogenase/5,10-methenyltetrahydrofolate cyclohydrolase [bacterium]